MSQLFATSDAGLCSPPSDGVTLLLLMGYGGLGGVDWPFLLSILETVGGHLDELGALYGGVIAIRDVTRLVRRRVDRGISALKSMLKENEHIDSIDLAMALEWAPIVRVSTLATGLNLHTTQARALLELLGYRSGGNEDQVHLSGDVDYRLARLIYDSAARSAVESDPELELVLYHIRHNLAQIMDTASREGGVNLDQYNDQGWPLLSTDAAWRPPE